MKRHTSSLDSIQKQDLHKIVTKQSENSCSP